MSTTEIYERFASTYGEHMMHAALSVIDGFLLAERAPEELYEDLASAFARVTALNARLIGVEHADITQCAAELMMVMHASGEVKQ